MKFTAAGLAMLVQVRVTELPSSTGPEGSTDTEVFLGGSERKIMFLVSIASEDFFYLFGNAYSAFQKIYKLGSSGASFRTESY